MTNALFWAVTAILATSFLVCAALVLTQRWHGRLSLDYQLNGAQKFHTVPVPRVGGMGLMVGLAIGVVVGHLLNGQTYQTAVLLVAAALPIFLAGLVEDTTKSVSPKTRMLASVASAGIAIALLDAHLLRVDVPLVDNLLLWTPLAMVFTCFAVSGMTNAINIIDGFNGLASGSVAIMLAGLGALAWQADDGLVTRLCLWGVAATLGFMVLNFPFGKIFLGDSGAYLAGFWLAECAILLLVRNPEVSTWTVLLCCIYPVWETIFSMWRKSFYRQTGMSNPDKVHFHMLIYRRMVPRLMAYSPPPWQRHALTSALIWMLVALCQLSAYFASKIPGSDHLAGVLGVVGFAFVYGLIYRSILVSVTARGKASVSTNQPASV